MTPTPGRGSSAATSATPADGTFLAARMQARWFYLTIETMPVAYTRKKRPGLTVQMASRAVQRPMSGRAQRWS
jgi:hypothetical protein